MSTKKTKDESEEKNNFSEFIEDITNMVKSSVYASLGVVILGQEVIKKWAKKIANENDLSTTDVKSFIRDVKQHSVEARKDVKKRVQSLLNEILPSARTKSVGDNKKKSKKKKKPVISSKKKSKKKKKTGASSRKKSHSDGSEGILIKEKEENEKAMVKETETIGTESSREANKEEII
ncbi:MAG: hypothetical protein JW976_12530 [Syntrophaceae bacterium]|nr:hypothetical protein [Syntrophaceae bacterium]